jgi:hypothetical protein
MIQNPEVQIYPPSKANFNKNSDMSSKDDWRWNHYLMHAAAFHFNYRTEDRTIQDYLSDKYDRPISLFTSLVHVHMLLVAKTCLLNGEDSEKSKLILTFRKDGIHSRRLNCANQADNACKGNMNQSLLKFSLSNSILLRTRLDGKR